MGEKSISKPVPETQKEFLLVLELISEEQVSDPALLTTLGRETIAILQQETYVVRPPAYTGQKGIESFLVEFVAIARHIATFVGNNHTVIAEDIADISGLVTIFDGIVRVLKCLLRVHEKQVGKADSVARPIKVTVEIDGAPLIIEVSDLADVEPVLKLALQYRSAHPAKATQVSMGSKVKVQGQVPARKKRRRR